MPCRLGSLPDVTRQEPRGPKLVRISHLLGRPSTRGSVLAGQRHHPCAGTIGNRWLLAGPRAVIERRHHAKPHCTIKASLHGLMGHTDRLTHCVGRRIGTISQEDAGSLNPTRPFRSRSRDRLQFKSLRSRSRLPTDVLSSYPSCLFAPDYNMWGHSGNLVQLVGSTESMTSATVVGDTPSRPPSRSRTPTGAGRRRDHNYGERRPSRLRCAPWPD
jgi:hypothetical protein